MFRVASLFVLLALASAKHEIYDGHALYEISVKSVEQTELVNYLTVTLDLDVWSHALPGLAGQVLVPKDKKAVFKNELSAAGVEFKLQTDNIKEVLELEDQLLAEASKKSSSKLDSPPFDQIYTYDQVNTFLDELAAAYPDVVTLVNAGKSFEGRDIKYLKISTSNFEDTSKPIVYMQSLLHAREWITLPATLYAIHKLVIDVTEQDLVQDIDWIILPIANPDGYIHSHDEARFWRKNRNTDYNSLFCAGVDLNRNFDINWSQASSNLVCMDTFHGSAPYSEPETQIIKEIFDEHRSRIQLSLDIHSFGSMILYGYGNNTLPSNGLLLHMVGVRMGTAIDAVKTSWNPNYVVGNVALVLYEASGTFGDYGSSIGIPYSYTYELPGYRFGLGGFGFLVDPDFIEQAGFETWEGIKEGARYVRDSFRK